jgi:hypothetical protein
MAEQRPIVLIDGKLSQLPIGDTIAGAGLGDYGVKFQYHLGALSAYDRVSSISYLDPGLRTQRIDSIVLSSVLYPDADITKTVFYLDVGSINQRIDKIEFVGSVFSPDSLRKTFSYSLSGIKYKCDGFNYELF